MARSMRLQHWLLWITTAALGVAALVALAWHGDAGRAAGTGVAAFVFGIIAVAVQRRARPGEG